MDLATILGLVVGFGAILLGNALEGGHIESLMQFTAGLIVVGGTIGAVMVSNTMHDLKTGLKYFTKTFFDSHESASEQIAEVIECAQLAKKESIIGLEKKLDSLKNKFFRDVLQCVIDGMDPAGIRDIFETVAQLEAEEIAAGSKVWTDAGGFAPTIGIIGAVLGLIHVMNNLSDPSKLGPGIAVAFVATVYGVSTANLIFLPVGNKIKKKSHHLGASRQAFLEAALMIGAGANVKIIEQKVCAYLGEKPSDGKKA